MVEIGKTIILLGGAIMAIGFVVLVAGKAGFRGLPGDVTYQRENLQFYFPVVSGIVLSVLLTLGVWLFRWFSGR